MLLRSITSHVKEQNWTAIFIDFFIVVVGVFVGIQVSNLNESRTDQHRARSYLERITVNLNADISNFKNRVDFWDQVSAYGDAALHYSSSGEKGEHSGWDILLSFFQASQVAEFYSTRTTYNEMTGAGELGLIKNLEIRNLISSYYTNADNKAFSERPKYRENVRGYFPIDVQNYIWENCYATDDNLTQKMTACLSPISQEETQRVLEKISSNEVLIRGLRYWMSTQHVMVLIAQSQMRRANGLYEMIQMELTGK